MKIAILAMGKVERDVLVHVQGSITRAFPKTEAVVLKDAIALPSEAYDAKRKQYYSSLLILVAREHLAKTDADKLLAVTNADLYVQDLNFIFGEAESPGKTAIVSLHRLRPEFYGNPANMALFLERAAKEAVHEIGHTFGLAHCSDPSCVMVFSNSIRDVDAKKLDFCKVCSQQLVRLVH